MEKELQEKQNDQVFAMILDSVGGDEEASATSFALSRPEKDWTEDEEEEGKLAVDVAHTKSEIIVVAPMAGSLADKIEVFIHNDLLTIRGVRSSSLDMDKSVEYYYQESFWGKFSRTIILPVEVKGDLAKAEYKNGVLKITIPKNTTDKKVPITIVEE